MVDRDRIERAMDEVIAAIGDDLVQMRLEETPRRVADMYADLFSGLDVDPKEVLDTTFGEEHRDIVVLKDVPFSSICEHHLLPFFRCPPISATCQMDEWSGRASWQGRLISSRNGRRCRSV